ncbi:MAG: histidinol-phosphatase [Alphaproteobacteria bacterium]|nr:histidinol-phosphatase [Alphaproteobacteria bacterium]
MAWFSFHGGHSGEFCRHAKDCLEAVVQRAVAAGFSHYGLTEHAPRFRPQDLAPEEADLSPSDLVDTFARYGAEAARLRDRYRDRIALFVGFETERLPPDDWAATMAGVRDSGPFEYIVGSVHDVDGVVIDFSPQQTRAAADAAGGREALQLKYFEALTDLVATLRPEVVGHLDLIRKFEPEAGFSQRVFRRIEDALEAARSCGAVLDVNCGAHRRGLGPVYPLPAILARARAMGLCVTLGDDSHGAATVGVGLDACLRAIADAGYDSVHHLARTQDGVEWVGCGLEDVAPHG